VTTLFISDLHLDGSRPAVTKLFFSFLAGEARDADALYILGDLFEAWVGDDDDDAHHQAVLSRLQDLTRHIPVAVMHGNRDFLLGERFEKTTGCRLMDEAEVVDLYGTPTLLLHGDQLCTDDTAYQQFRTMARDPGWQRMMLAKPLAERREIARQARDRSTIENAMKADAIMDVNADAVADAMRTHGVTRMIHGHTHRPAIHEFQLDGVPATRIVLGDWYDQGSVLRVHDDGCSLNRL
jgi:UDP-2,3-diacylglucosamine hydrolase